jgi:hypothetical protein
MTAHEQFKVDHAPDATRLNVVEHELEQHLVRRAQIAVEQPSAYQLQILGPVPADQHYVATWMSAAVTLDRHHLGLDPDPTHLDVTPDRYGRQRAETLARLEVVAIPREREPITRTLERGLGLDLFG